MRLLVDYDSDGHPESDPATSDPPDETPAQSQVFPVVDATIQETKLDVERTRLNVDQLFRKFSKEYVAIAGQLREDAIQRYRERLEGLSAKDCAKVCETLAKDEIFCCNMEFGNGHLSSGGIGFKYKAESDAAFNALSHHAWKDLHEVFVKDNSCSLLGDTFEKPRRSQALLIHSDDEEDELESYPKSSHSSFEEREPSYNDKGSLSCDDSVGAFQIRKRERSQNSSSLSPDWAAEDQAGSSDAQKERGPGQPSKEGGRDVPKKRGPGMTPNEPWSAEEESVIRETMATQLQMDGHLRYSRQATTNLNEVFPRRTAAAIKNKWLSMRKKEIWDEWEVTRGETQVGDAKSKDIIEDPGSETHGEESSGSLMIDDDDDDGDSSYREGRRGLREKNSRDKKKWTPEQDLLLSKTMQSEMQSAGVEHMSVPLTVKKELARSFGRREKAISQRWLFLSGHNTWDGLKKWKKKKRNVVPVRIKSALQDEGQAPASSSRLPHSEQPRRTEAAEASQSRRKIRPAKEHRTQVWSPQEIEILTKLTKGLNKREDINFKYIAAQLPDPSKRSEKACKTFWARRVESSQTSKDKNPTNGDEVAVKSPDSSSDLGPPKSSTKTKKRGPEASSSFGSSKLSKKAKRVSQDDFLV